MKLARNQQTILVALFFCCTSHLIGQTAPPDEYLAVNPRPVSGRPFEVTPARVERGRYLTEGILFCFHCHSERDESQPGAPVIETTKGAGSVTLDSGANFIPAPNITPDKETGSGNWSDDTLARAIREGVGHNGRALANKMPYGQYRSLSDEDIKSVVVYLRTLKPIRNKLPPRKLTKAGGDAAVASASPIAEPIPHPNPDDQLLLARYLVTVGDCQGCHTRWFPKNPGVFGGGNDVYRRIPEKRGRVFSANISSDPTGVGTWPAEVFIEVIRTGKAGTLDGAMPWQAFKNVNNEDLTAILAFLKTTAPVEHRIAKDEPPTWCEVCEQNHGLGAENKMKVSTP